MIRTRRTGLRAPVRIAVLAATAAGLLAVTACGTTDETVAAPPAAVTAAKAEPVALKASTAPPPVVLPVKADLGQQYLELVSPYNRTLSAQLPTFCASNPSLSRLRAAAGRIADANWTLLTNVRTLKESIAPPATGYPSGEEGTYYRGLYASLAALLEEKTADQVAYAAMRDAPTWTEFNIAYASLSTDGVAPRKVRALLSLTDVPSTKALPRFARV